jgi:hypothetical protein
MTRRDNTTRRRAKGLWTGGQRFGTTQPDTERETWVPVPPLPLAVDDKPVVRFRRAKTTVEESGLEPYWGKPAVRNLRGGEGNVMQGLVTVCHEAPKGGDIGSH